MPPKKAARFIEPMLLLRTDALPNDAGDWEYQLKLDGYRAIAFKTRGRVQLRSRNDNDFSIRYPAIVQGLAKLPDETVIDGEVIGLDEDGRPSFSVLQNYGSSKAPVVYFVFDVMMLAGQDVMKQPLTDRRQLLERKVLPRLTDPVRYAGPLAATLPVLIESVKAQGLEGLVAKRLDSRYESGLRTGAWQKMRINRGQEFVVGLHGRGEYVRRVGLRVLRRRSADVCGSNAQRLYADRAPAGVQEVPRLGEIKECPFANLPEAKSGRWGAGLTAAGMKDCRWLKPVLVAQIEFLEWTGDNHLRHTKFVALRDDKPAEQVRRE